MLPTSLLRSSVDVFTQVITHIANLSFVECRFPAAFKTAQVLPLLKKLGLDKEQMSNYRPISNLTTVSKVIERLVLVRLRPYLLTSPSFCTSIVSLSTGTVIRRNSTTARHEQCVRGC